MTTAITSSCVWFTQNAMDTQKGLLCYGSRNVVHIYNISGKTPVYEDSLVGHLSRVNSCRFCHSEDIVVPLLVTAADDGFVKVWDVSARKIKQFHSKHLPAKITCVDWSTVNTDLIISGDQKGFIWTYSVSTSRATKIEMGRNAGVNVIVFSPSSADLFVAGFKNGSINIFSISKNAVCHKLRGVTCEVQAISWNNSIYTTTDFQNFLIDKKYPVKDEDLIDSELIVIGSRDKTIKLFNATSSKLIRVFKIPSKMIKGRRGSDDYNSCFPTLFWPSSSKFKFLSSGLNGEIILWNLEKKGKGLTSMIGSDLLSSCHSKLIMCLVPGLNRSCDVISTSSDRAIKYWVDVLNSPSKPPIWSLPTIGGFVYSLQPSPSDPSTVAVASGDGKVLIWRSLNPNNPFDVSTLSKNGKDKYFAISWHPHDPEVIAFGTESGRVGVYDLNKPDRPIMTDGFHLQGVYSLTWGPQCSPSTAPTPATPYSIYAVGGGSLLMHYPPPCLQPSTVEVLQVAMTTNPFLKLSDSVSEISWDRDFRLLAIGFYNGRILIFSAPHLHYLVTIALHDVLINSIAWSTHPGPETRNWIASASKSNKIEVADVSAYLEPSNAEVDVKKSTRTLIGHSDRVTCLAWNPNQAGMLASASYDGTIEIWDVLKELPLANYRGHSARLLSVCWGSSKDVSGEEQRVFSGGEDYAVHVWRRSDQSHVTPPTKRSDFAKRGRDKSRANTLMIRRKRAEETKDMNELIEKKKNLLLSSDLLLASQDPSPTPAAPPAAAGDQKFSQFKEFMNQVSESRSELPSANFKYRPKKPLMKLTTSKDIHLLSEMSINFAKHVNSLAGLDQTAPDLTFDSIYFSRASMFKSVYEEHQHQICSHSWTSRELFDKHSSFEHYVTLKSWYGDINGIVDEATSSGRLNDHIVAMSASVSHELYQKVSSLYAAQLRSFSNYLRASTFYIAANQFSEAVDCLLEGRLFREAFTLSRIRFGDKSERSKKTVQTILVENKSKLQDRIISQMLVIVGEYKRAVKNCELVLTRLENWSDPDCVIHGFQAAAICRLDPELTNQAVVHGHKCLLGCLHDGNWKTSLETVELVGNLTLIFKILILAHELLVMKSSLTEKDKIAYFGDDYKSNQSETFNSTDVNNISFTRCFQEVLSTVLDEKLVNSKELDLLFYDATNYLQFTRLTSSSNTSVRHHFIKVSILLAIFNLFQWRSNKDLETKDEDLMLASKHQKIAEEVAYNEVFDYLMAESFLLMAESSLKPNKHLKNDDKDKSLTDEDLVTNRNRSSSDKDLGTNGNRSSSDKDLETNRNRSSSDEDLETNRNRSSSDKDLETNRNRSSSDKDLETNGNRSSSDKDLETNGNRSSSDEDLETNRNRSSSDEDLETNRNRSSSDKDLETNGNRSSSDKDLGTNGNRTSSDKDLGTNRNRSSSDKDLGTNGNRSSSDKDLGTNRNRSSSDEDLGTNGNRSSSDKDLGTNGNRSSSDKDLGTNGNRTSSDKDLGTNRNRSSSDEDLGTNGNRSSSDKDLGTNGNRSSFDKDLGANGNGSSSDKDLGANGNGSSSDKDLGTNGNRSSSDKDLGTNGNRSSSDKDLETNGNRSSFDKDLETNGNRSSSDKDLGANGNRSSSDKDLGANGNRSSSDTDLDHSILKEDLVK